MSKRSRLLIVAYDIVSGRRRNRVAECLSGYGWRVNYSVFACQAPMHDVTEIRRKIEALIKRPEDSAIYFVLCASCRDWAEQEGGLVCAKMVHIL